jgi:uncharacterized membrane protein
MALTAIALSQLAISLDQWTSIELAKRFFPFYRTSPAGVRAVLSVTASSMITVAGVVFSLTMVVLSLTSQQYGSLVLENFMRDRKNQFVLGAFTSTFLYCLLVLRTVQDAGDTTFIPRIASLIGVALAILSVGVLIYFIHHVSSSVQATTVIWRASQDLLATIETLYPEMLGIGDFAAEDVASPKPDDFVENVAPIPAGISGYIQLIDSNQLMQVATEHDLLLSLFNRPGDFILEGGILGELYPKERATDEIIEAINAAIQLGNERTYKQDMRLAFNQMVEIALRALSPGINAPYTAISCIDFLGQGLLNLARRRLPSSHRHDSDQNLRIIVENHGFAEMLKISFDEIRHYSKENAGIACHILTILAKIKEALGTSPHHETIRDYAHVTWLEYHHFLRLEREKQELDACYAPFNK